MTTVERIEVAPGFSISRVLTGLWQIADMERDGRQLDLNQAAAAMRPYVEAGFTTFDMADHYGSAELIAGKFRDTLSPAKSAQFFTKWVPKPGPITREDVRTAVQTALKRLQTDQLDLLQYHCWTYADPIWLDTLYWLQELRDEGLIRHLGITNVDTAHLRIALSSGIDLITNQVSYSLLDQRASGAMSALCREFGVKILAFGTVAGGFLTERWLDQPEPAWEKLPTWSLLKYGRYIRIAGGWSVFQNLLQTMKRIAQKHHVSIANIACKAILDNPAVGGVIIGARLGQSQHIEDNLRLFSFELDNEDRGGLTDALAELKPLPGDCGDEYRKPPLLTAAGDLSDHLDRFPAPYEVKKAADGRTHVMSGTKWEKIAGYCRAVRRDSEIFISGTTATHGEKLIGAGDAAAQTHFIIDKIEGTLHTLGARLEDVVRTRMYVRHLDDWEAAARAHGHRFGDILPANTLVQADLVGDDYLVEIEAEARVD